MSSTGVINRSDHIYTSCYCEENTYKFLERMVTAGAETDDGTDEWYCVFISACEGPIEAEGPGKWKGYFTICNTLMAPTLQWDYHVISVRKSKDTAGASTVYDFDTGIGFPAPFTDYVLKSFSKAAEAKFRVIPAREYLEHMASDRSHMRNNRG
eukprot:PhF_6_TR19033/c0_g1_i3/m.27949/K21286/NTAQ1; protein N-terminal glutamine amidohydrolase